MPIPLRCPSCQARLTAPDKAIGRMLPCPSCKTRLLVKPSVREEASLKPALPELRPEDFILDDEPAAGRP